MQMYSISETKQELKNGIRAYLSTDAGGNPRYPLVNRIPFYLEGPPGIGKTEITKQVAEELGIGFCSFSITHHTRNSLLGLPVIKNLEDGGKYTEFTMSDVIAGVMQQKEKGFSRGILLLDEFNCASETLMPAMLAFLQTRNIGAYRLPDEWIIVLCGNPKNYNPSARDFGPAIMDRVRRITIESQSEAFLSYAKEQGFHPVICSYLENNRDKIFRITSEGEEKEIVTNRSWENLSHTLRAYEEEDLELTEKTVEQYIKSKDIAESFFRFWWMEQNKFTNDFLEKVLEGKATKKMRQQFAGAKLITANHALKILEERLLSLSRTEPAEKLSACISHVIRFLKGSPYESSLTEKLFYFITEQDALLDAVSAKGNPEYLELARRSYAIPQKGECA